MSRAFVYAIGVDWKSPIKIGVASNVTRRLERLQSGNHLKLAALWQSHACANPFAVEAALHQEFAKHRIRGEWFSIPDASAAALEAAFARYDGAITSPKNAPKADTCVAAINAVRTLVEIAVRTGLKSEDAIGKVASNLDVGRSLIWSLLYRPPADLWVTQYAKVAAGAFSAAGKPAFALADLPDAITLRLVTYQLRHLHGLPEVEDRQSLVATAEAALGIAEGGREATEDHDQSREWGGYEQGGVK